MKNVIPMRTDDQISDEAIDWIARLDRTLSDEETQQFQFWITSSNRHRDVFVAYAQLWDKMDAVSMLAELFPEPEAESTLFGGFRAMAASVIAAALILSSVMYLGWFEDVFKTHQTIIVQQDFSTQVGEQATFYLQDKTKVELNTNSRLRVTYTDKQRLFELQQGELHVTVAHNQRQPLSVYAGGQIIQAVGTAFNVELKTDSVELIVTDGKVRVQEQIVDDPLSLDDVRLPTSAMAVSKGQWVNVTEGIDEVNDLNELDLAAALSWQTGELIFRGESLFDALKEVERYTDFEFRYSDDSLKQIKVAGLFKTNNIDNLLIALEENFNVENHKLADNIIQLSPSIN